MRGSAQAKLIECSDGHLYVVKLTNNPQTRRTLVNEVIASELLCHLRLPVPVWRAVHVDSAWLRENPLHLQFGARTVSAPAGLHFGSRFCGSFPPDRAIYDWLPTSLLRTMRMMPEFVGMLVADQWISNR